MDFSVTEATLRAFFSGFGEVSDAAIATDYYSKRSRGFGFVEFESDAVAKSVIADEKPHFLAGRKIFIQEYKKYS